MLLYLLDHDVATVWTDVEITNVEARSEVRELPFGARVEIDCPQILMTQFSSHYDERPPVWEEHNAPGAACECQLRYPVRIAGRGDRFERKRSADIGARKDDDAAVRRPGWID